MAMCWKGFNEGTLKLLLYQDIFSCLSEFQS